MAAKLHVERMMHRNSIAVAGESAASYALIKLIPTGIIDFKKGQVTSAPQMSLEEVTQLVAAAKSFGRRR